MKASAHLSEDTILAEIVGAVERYRLEEIEAKIAGDEDEFFPRFALRRVLELNKAQLPWDNETLGMLARHRSDSDRMDSVRSRWPR